MSFTVTTICTINPVLSNLVAQRRYRDCFGHVDIAQASPLQLVFLGGVRSDVVILAMPQWNFVMGISRKMEIPPHVLW